MKHLKGWRTILFNALSFAVLLLAMPEFIAVLPPEWVPWAALGNVLGNMALRYVTTTPMGQKA